MGRKAGMAIDASAFFLVDQENSGLDLSCQRDRLGLAFVEIVPQSGGELAVPGGSAP